MEYTEWLLLVIIIAISFFGGYYLLLITAHMKEEKRATAWIAGWFFHPEYLDETGKAYRKKIIGCWIVVLFIAVGIKLFK